MQLMHRNKKRSMINTKLRSQKVTQHLAQKITRQQKQDTPKHQEQNQLSSIPKQNLRRLINSWRMPASKKKLMISIKQRPQKVTERLARNITSLQKQDIQKHPA